MSNWRRAGVSMAGVATVALLLAGCASSGVSSSSAYSEDIVPIQSLPVATSSLPALGPDGAVQTADMSRLPSPAPLDPSMGASSDPMLAQQQGAATLDQNGQPMQVANADSSFVTLDAMGSVPDAPGRDLSSGLTIEKLLGGWTVVAGAEQCKLNLTYTTKTGTNRYRASTPGCTLSGLRVVASWQLLGSQVQLFDENGDIIASLILSGNRFIGTLAGGQGISMVG
jgi:hypothetical protein